MDGYKSIFMGRGGISNFIIYDKNKEIMIELNEKFNRELRKIWKIMKRM